MAIYEEISLMSKAKYPILWVQTSEEVRLGKMLNRIAKELKRDFLCWTVTEGLRNAASEPVGGQGTNTPTRMLEEVRKYTNPAIVMLKDPHPFFKDPGVVRRYRDAYHVLKGMRKTIVICSPMLEIPPEMMQEITIVDFDLPEDTELKAIMYESLDGLREMADEGDEKAIELLPVLEKQMKSQENAIIQAGLGLTSETFENIVAKCVAAHSIDVATILQEKKQAIRKGGLLEFYPVNTTMNEVGGLDNLKNWLDLREKAFSPQAQAYGLPAPKGVILVGIPGTGKSLVAKALAARWKLPLLRLDAGSLFGSLVGQSEDRTRKALAMAESMSPCILWVDEVEKAFSFGQGDSGTSQRVFATILTWMQDKKKPVFMIATANNISMLPPELQRKGRFDEIFFLDMPNAQERKEIVEVHLKKAARNDPKNFDMDRLVDASAEFVGAEIEQAIIDAMYVAFADGMRKINTDDVVNAMRKVVPISKSQGESIKALRLWLEEGRATSATGAPKEQKKVTRKVEV